MFLVERIGIAYTLGYEPVRCQGAAGVSCGAGFQSFGIAVAAMARRRNYSQVTKMLLIAAVSGLDLPRSLARRGVLAHSLLFVPGAAYAGIADQLEAASRASEITYSQNGTVRKSTSASGRPGGIIYYSGSLDAARECLASSHEAS